MVNLSLIPLPKIDEMYANLHGAKVFITLYLRSGYYHIGFDKECKAKTAFATPFGKYEFNSGTIWLSTNPLLTFSNEFEWFLQDC